MLKGRATILFRPNRFYRADEFARGLERHGFSTSRWANRNPTPNDLLVIWNRKRQEEQTVRAYERAGARVIVVENGFLDRIDGRKYYALALNHHNGVGRWFVGDKARFEIRSEPIPRGDHVLILPQRGIGEKGVAMPYDWPRTIRDRIAKISGRPVIFRRHPGVHPQRQPALEQELARAHCVVTWASGAAIKAIRAGIPCYHELDAWIANCASTRLADSLERCNATDSGELWRRVSWATWRMEEIQSGEAFDRLLHENHRSLFCAKQS